MDEQWIEPRELRARELQVIARVGGHALDHRPEIVRHVADRGRNQPERDRLEQILKNYLLGLGEYSAAFGPGEDDRWIRSDFDSKRWRQVTRTTSFWRSASGASSLTG